MLVRVTGRLDIPGSMTLWARLRRTPVDRPMMVVDLAGVPEADPCALAVLVATQHRLRKSRSRLALDRVPHQPMQLMRARRQYRDIEVLSIAS